MSLNSYRAIRYHITGNSALIAQIRNDFVSFGAITILPKRLVVKKLANVVPVRNKASRREDVWCSVGITHTLNARECHSQEKLRI
jgi:hypothetical protein